MHTKVRQAVCGTVNFDYAGKVAVLAKLSTVCHHEQEGWPTRTGHRVVGRGVEFFGLSVGREAGMYVGGTGSLRCKSFERSLARITLDQISEAKGIRGRSAAGTKMAHN